MKGTVKSLCLYWLQQNSGRKTKFVRLSEKAIGLANSEFHLLKKYGLSFFTFCILIFFIFLKYVGGFLVLIEKMLLNRMAEPLGPLPKHSSVQLEPCLPGWAAWVFKWQSCGDRTGFSVEMVVDCHGFNLTSKNALLWERTCTCMLHGSCFCSVCVCVCARVCVFRLFFREESLTLSY